MTHASVFRHLKKSFIAFIVIASLVGSPLSTLDVQAAQGTDIALVGGTISVFPADVFQHDEVQVNVTVANRGETDMDNVGVALYVNTRDNPVATATVDAAAGEQYNITLRWFAGETGNHTLFVLVDYDDQFQETNEDNNMGSRVVDVREPTYPPFPPAAQDAEWWHSNWHYRVPVTVMREGHRDGFVYEDKMVQRTFDFTGLMDVIKQNQTAGTFPTGAFDPDSVRVVSYVRENETWHPEQRVGHELVFSDDYDPEDNANVTVMWTLAGASSPHEVRHYYVYWDTAGNGDIAGSYGDIAAGIKNPEFEGGSTGWKNTSEPTVGVPIPGFDDISTWQLSTAASPTDPTDTCYRVYRRGIIWQEGWYGKVYQHFTVPDGGDASGYTLHADVYFNDTVLDGVAWEVTLDGQVVETGGVTGGWQSIDADVTSYVEDKGTATLSFRVYVTALDAQLTADVAAYIDACWLEVTPNPNVSVLSERAHGWWGRIADGVIDGMPVDQPPTYVAGVAGRNTVTTINVSAVAGPREVMATLQYPAPRNTIVKKSIPLPDAGFESGASYTTTFYSNEQTTSASFAGVAHSGAQGVELRLSDYHGKYKMLDQPVSPDDMVGFRQEVSQTMLVSHIPSLWFWYRVDGYTAQSTLDVTLMTAGSPDRMLSIQMSELTTDGGWHQYVIPQSTLDSWRSGAGTLTGIEVRLTANTESGENTLYIDDMGYAFMPVQGSGRRNWQLPDFYSFAADAETGMWALTVTMTDSAGYRVTNVTSLKVEPAANLNVEDISAPADINEGETATVTVTVANTGRKDVAASPPVNVSLSISQGDEPVKLVKDLGALSAGTSKELAFTWRASYGIPDEDGRWEIRAEANKDDVIPETNKGDNWNVQFIEVTPRPDLELHMYDIGFTPLHPDVNETVNISVLLHNTGYQDTTATLQIYVKEENASRYTLIPNGTVEQIIGKRTNETVYATWTPAENGTYAVKAAASCLEESRTGNNQAVKDIRVGGPYDTTPPLITNVRISNVTRFRGDPINISANIRDNETTIDEAVVVISGDNGNEHRYQMYRVGDTNIYYYNASYSTVGYYSCHIEAYDTGGDGTGRRNQAVSDSMPFRVVHEGVETTPPSIAGVTAVPERQVIGEPVNVSVAIQDEHLMQTVLLYVTAPSGDTSTYTMTGAGGSYHYARAYETPGEYTCYVEAIDASANHNKNDTADQPISFSIPVDYDSDGIPDTIEREAGANPRERGDNVNVSVSGAMGYLLWKMDAEEYVYWDVEDGQLRSVDTDVIDGAKVILFDADGDGEYDHYYDEDNKAIRTYSPPAEQGIGAVIWAVPAAILFALVCIMFVLIRRKAA